MDDLEELIRAARKAAQRRPPKEVEVGQLAGLLDTGRARLQPSPGESLLHHAGYLAGHLIRWLHEHGRPLAAPTLLTAAVYGTGLAEAPGQRKLAQPNRRIDTHTYAAIRVEQETGAPIDGGVERMLFGWLLEQTDTPATPQLIAQLERLRARRLERSGLRADPPAEC
jgi:hypothetical protein